MLFWQERCTASGIRAYRVANDEVKLKTKLISFRQEFLEMTLLLEQQYCAGQQTWSLHFRRDSRLSPVSIFSHWKSSIFCEITLIEFECQSLLKPVASVFIFLSKPKGQTAKRLPEWYSSHHSVARDIAILIWPVKAVGAPFCTLAWPKIRPN